MPFPKRLLLDHEELVFDLKPHWIAIVPAVLWGIVSVVAGWLLLTLKALNDGVPRTIVLLAVLLSLVILTVAPILRWMFTMFVLTSDRLVTRRGIVAKQSKEIPLERINDVSFSQSIFERMVGAGDLLIESAGERGQERISHVRKPESVQMRIYKVMEDNANRMSRPAAPERREDTIPEQLEALARLKEAGTISEDEFQSKKAELLKRM